MKKLFTLLAFVFFSQAVFAGSGVFEYYLDTKLGGTTKNHGSYGGGTAFAGDNLGTVPNTSTPLIIDLTGLKTYKNSGSNVTGATLFYRVYRTGTTAPAFSSQNLPFFANLASAGDQEWQNGADINLLAASLSGPGMSAGTYNVDVYITASTSDGGASYASEMTPYTATFVLAVSLSAEMTSFSAKKSTTATALSWTTASEKNNGMFQIERSANATDFSPIGEVKGAGNSNAVNNYTFTDAAPLSGVNYYRLKAVDYNGAVTLSKVISVNFTGKSGDKTAAYPNPVSDVLRIDYTATDVTTTTIQVTDLTGRILISQNVSVSKGANLLPFNVSNLPSGAYLVRINNDITRFVKM